MTSWLRSMLMLAVLLITMAVSSSTKIGGDTMQHRFFLDRKIEQVTYAISPTEITAIAQVDSQSSVYSDKENEDYHGTRGSMQLSSVQRQRQTQDVEDMLQDMATRDPSEWSPAEWILMILFLAFFSWIGCCLLSLCCCGRSNILGWLCCYEICCRGGTDIDACCDYALA